MDLFSLQAMCMLCETSSYMPSLRMALSLCRPSELLGGKPSPSEIHRPSPGELCVFWVITSGISVVVEGVLAALVHVQRVVPLLRLERCLVGRHGLVDVLIEAAVVEQHPRLDLGQVGIVGRAAVDVTADVKLPVRASDIIQPVLLVSLRLPAAGSLAPAYLCHCRSIMTQISSESTHPAAAQIPGATSGTLARYRHATQ
jgi:hypothetical protein